MMLTKDSRSVRTCCTSYVGSDIRDGQLEREYMYLLYGYIQDYQGCVDSLNTEGARGSTDTCKDYVR